MSQTSPKRFQVFVSSPYNDLKPERNAVIQALLRINCFPLAMEFLPASSEGLLDLLGRCIRESDFVIAILAARYGSEADGIGYTEREVEIAKESGVPILAFLHANPGEVAASKTDLDQKTRERLDNLREMLGKNGAPTLWSTVEDLATKVTASLCVELNRIDRPGWVRGQSALNAEEFLRLRNRVDELVSELERTKTTPPPDTENLAQGREEFQISYKQDLGETIEMGSIGFSWDRLFSIVGPKMFSPVNYSEIERTINETLDNIIYDTRARPVQVDRESLGTIILQFQSLGLIEIRDGQEGQPSGWTLTKYGRHRVAVLKAVPTKKAIRSS